MCNGSSGAISSACAYCGNTPRIWLQKSRAGPHFVYTSASGCIVTGTLHIHPSLLAARFTPHGIHLLLAGAGPVRQCRSAASRGAFPRRGGGSIGGARRNLSLFRGAAPMHGRWPGRCSSWLGLGGGSTILVPRQRPFRHALQHLRASVLLSSRRPSSPTLASSHSALTSGGSET